MRVNYFKLCQIFVLSRASMGRLLSIVFLINTHFKKQIKKQVFTISKALFQDK